MDKKIISFSVDDFESTPTLEEINESQFMKTRLRFFSDGITRHGYGFDLDTIKKTAFTILGKPLLYRYSMWTDDASGHEKDEVQCGFVPKDEADADIKFEYDENLDKTFVSCNAYIWKVYQKELVRILERDDGYKKVSVEMWLIEYDESKKSELGYIPVKNLCYNGITILGEDVTEACQGANMEVVKFSTEEYNKAQNIFINQLNNSFKQGAEDASFLIQKNEQKEDVMAKGLENAATETPEVLENGTKVTTTDVSLSGYTNEYDDEGNFVGSTSEYHSKSETKVEETTEDTSVIDNAVKDDEVKEDVKEEENACQTKVDNACKTEENAVEPEKLDNAEDMKEECNEKNIEEKCSTLEVKCSSLESELETLKNSYSQLEEQFNLLNEYKANKENEEKTLAIECALNEMTDVLSADEISQWRKKSLNCTSVDGFKNELKAFAYDKQKENGVKPVETLRNSIPQVHEEEPTNVWDRLAKTI